MKQGYVNSDLTSLVWCVFRVYLMKTLANKWFKIIKTDSSYCTEDFPGY